MRTLYQNAKIVNVFIDALEEGCILVEDAKIIGVGDYQESDADHVVDLKGKIVCPGFFDGHIHIESSMLEPSEFARVCLLHGTTTVIADPHEIANVSGMVGMEYMFEASEGIPMNIYYMVPSCVPATSFDEAGSVLYADQMEPLLNNPRVLGLGEMMNYPGVVFEDSEVFRKINLTREKGMLVNGHAPLLSGHSLDKYISSGIFDDHECSSFDEALERLKKGQWIMIREGTAARNLSALIDLFEEPYSRRCMLVTDDKHPADLLEQGHIDNIIRKAVAAGKSPFAAIRMASFQPAQYFGLKDHGAIAPGYVADFVILNDLETVDVCDVYHNGELVVSNKKNLPFARPFIRTDIWKAVRNSFFLKPLTKEQFMIEAKGSKCRVIQMIPGQLLTEELIMDLDFSKNQGIDIERDIVKLAVIERHNNTGHIGLGYIRGIGLKCGAIASSVSHDSHNLIVAGANEEDMTIAANRLREVGGGLIVVKDGEVLAEMPLPIGGLISKKKADILAAENELVREKALELGIPEDHEPFMSLAFISLPVIPALKMTTKGLVDVTKQELVPLFLDA